MYAKIDLKSSQIKKESVYTTQLQVTVFLYLAQEKKKEIWTQSFDKSQLTQQKIGKKRNYNSETLSKTSITQRLRIDFRRSVGVTTATKLMWLNRLTGSQPSH